MTARMRPHAAPSPDADGSGPPADAAAVALWIQPRAARDAVIGEREDMVAIRLQAPPVDGAANAALLRFLARRPAGAAEMGGGDWPFGGGTEAPPAGPQRLLTRCSQPTVRSSGSVWM
jgi:hypothetical protein